MGNIAHNIFWLNPCQNEPLEDGFAFFEVKERSLITEHKRGEGAARKPVFIKKFFDNLYKFT